MQKWLGIVCLALACSPMLAASDPAVTKAYTDSKGWVHILTTDNRDHMIRPEQWQSGGGFRDVKIAPDGKTVGWLAEQMLSPLEGGTSYSYPVAFRLDIWRDGRVIRKFSTPSSPIDNWLFLKGGSEVAFHIRPTHGMEQYECFLFDITAGKKLASWWIPDKGHVVPDWAKPLLVNDMPSPQEYVYWLENLQDTKTSHTQPK